MPPFSRHVVASTRALNRASYKTSITQYEIKDLNNFYISTQKTLPAGGHARGAYFNSRFELARDIKLHA